MTQALKKLLLEYLLHGENNIERRVNGGDRRRTYTFVLEDRRIGSPDRRMGVSDLLNRIQHKYKRQLSG